MEHHIHITEFPIKSCFQQLDGEKLAAKFLLIQRNGIIRRSDSPELRVTFPSSATLKALRPPVTYNSKGVLCAATQSSLSTWSGQQRCLLLSLPPKRLCATPSTWSTHCQAQISLMWMLPVNTWGYSYAEFFFTSFVAAIGFFFSKKLEPAQTSYSAFDHELWACYLIIWHFITCLKVAA
jgi:hypothetical protein